jgi:hypothetical protein
VKAIEIPEAQKVSLEGVYGAIGKVQAELNRVPKDGFDPAETHRLLSQIMEGIRNIPEPKETDLSAIEQAIFQVAEQLHILDTNLKSFGKVVIGDMEAIIKDLSPKLLDSVQSGLHTALTDKPISISLDKLLTERPKKEEASHADISHLLHA